MRELRTSGSVGTAGEQSPVVTRPSSEKKLISGLGLIEKLKQHINSES